MKDYPFIKFSILFICGIILQYFIHPNIWVYISGLTVLLFILLAKKINNPLLNFSFVILSAIVIVISGMITAEYDKSGTFFLSENLYKQNNFICWGTIKNIELSEDDGYSFIMNTDSISIEGKSLKWSPILIVKVKDNSIKKMVLQYEHLYPGNKVKVIGVYIKGREERNPGEFDYNRYLRREGISGIVNLYYADSLKVLDNHRFAFLSFFHWMRKNIDKTLKQFHSIEAYGLLKGLLLADRRSIDYETKSLFVNSGVVHVLAVSGLHVGFVAIIFYFLFGRLNVYLRIYFTIAGLLFFMFLTGVPASVFRATVMAIMILIGRLTERTTNIYNSLAIAAVILLIIDPSEIFNPGFQLSFSAVFSIAFFYPIFSKKLNGFRLNKYLKYILLFFAVSLSAQIGTLPFTLIYFGKISVTSLAANLVVIPLIGIMVGIGITTILFAIVSSYIASVYAAANNTMVWLLLKIVKFAGNPEYSFIRIPDFSIIDVLLFYAILILSMIMLKYAEKFLVKIFIFCSAISIFFIVSSFDDKKLISPGELTVIMIDVGQGDSFLLSFPNGKTALIDAGEAVKNYSVGERVIIPLMDKLKINKIDYAFISHFDNDHYGGMVSLISQHKINKVYFPATDTSSKADRFIEYLDNNKIAHKKCGSLNMKESGLSLYALCRRQILGERYSSNDNSIIVKVIYGNNSFLFTGDLEKRGESYFLNNSKEFLNSDVLKIAHHGSSGGTSDEFLNAVTPRFSLISAGIKNKFRHPSKEVLKKLRNHKSLIYRTDISGAVILKSDGENISEVNWR